MKQFILPICMATLLVSCRNTPEQTEQPTVDFKEN